MWQDRLFALSLTDAEKGQANAMIMQMASESGRELAVPVNVDIARTSIMAMLSSRGNHTFSNGDICWAPCCVPMHQLSPHFLGLFCILTKILIHVTLDQRHHCPSSPE